MELDDLAAFNVRNFIGMKDIRGFLIQENIFSDYQLYGMLTVHYFNNTKDSCFFEDIMTVSREKVRRKIAMSYLKLVNDRYIRIIGEDPVLGKQFELTNKGRGSLGKYLIYLRKQEKDVWYKIKENNRRAKEGEKKF